MKEFVAGTESTRYAIYALGDVATRVNSAFSTWGNRCENVAPNTSRECRESIAELSMVLEKANEQLQIDLSTGSAWAFRDPGLREADSALQAAYREMSEGLRLYAANDGDKIRASPEASRLIDAGITHRKEAHEKIKAASARED